MQLEDESIYAGTIEANYAEISFQFIDCFHKGLIWLTLLVITMVVPLDYRVFNFANTAQIAVDLHNLVLVLMMVILIICQDGLLGWNAHPGREPINTTEVKNSLHVEVVYSKFNCISFAYRRNWLDIWTSKHFFGQT